MTRLTPRQTIARRLPQPGRDDGLIAWRVDNKVGESPVWDAARARLWWIDVRAPELLCLDPLSDSLLRWTLPEPVGALALCTNGELLLALRTEAWRFSPRTDELAPFAAVETDRPGNRLNDGKVSPGGRWWLVGSMDDRGHEPRQASGALYRLDGRGSCAQLHAGLAVANGIAWSADGAELLFSDSARGEIWRADWDEASGTLGTPRPFAQSGELDGRPDGAVVDRSGHYLSAGVSAGCLNRFDAHGRRLQPLALPCRAPTMPAFGGASGQDLFITSLVRPQWSSPPGWPDGQLYCLPGFGGGLPPARFALG